MSKLKNHSLKLNFRFSTLAILLAVILFFLFQLGLYKDIINWNISESSSIEKIVGVIGRLLTIGIIFLAYAERIKLKEFASGYKELCNLNNIKDKEMEAKL